VEGQGCRGWGQPQIASVVWYQANYAVLYLWAVHSNELLFLELAVLLVGDSAKLGHRWKLNQGLTGHNFSMVIVPQPGQATPMLWKAARSHHNILVPVGVGQGQQ
jgi:hypothetical protein